MRYHNSKSRAWKQSEITRIKTESGCVDCGYNRCSQALEFDHVGEKNFTIATSVVSNRPWQAVLDEIAMCEVVCANCHRERTVSRRG